MEVGQAAGRSDKNTYIHSQTTSVLTASGMMCQLMRVHIKINVYQCCTQHLELVKAMVQGSSLHIWHDNRLEIY